jgi:hypothetical protein
MVDAKFPHKGQQGDSCLGLSDQIESKEQGGQWRLGGFHDCVCGKARLLATLPTLVPHKSLAIDQAVLPLSATRTDEALRPTRLFESGLTILLCAIDLHELGQGHP